MLRRLVGLAALAISACPAPALACKGPHLLFSDNFATVDRTWNFDPDTAALTNIGAGPVTPEGGKMKVKPPSQGAGWSRFYRGVFVRDADICVNIRSPNNLISPDQTSAGLLFWNENQGWYLYFSFNPKGDANLWEHYEEVRQGHDGTKTLSTNWANKLSWPSVPGAGRGASLTNTLRVTMKGDTLTLYVNDQARSIKFTDGAPDSGTQFGLRVVSENAEISTWKFSRLRVTDLTPE